MEIFLQELYPAWEQQGFFILNPTQPTVPEILLFFQPG